MRWYSGEYPYWFTNLRNKQLGKGSRLTAFCLAILRNMSYTITKAEVSICAYI